MSRPVMDIERFTVLALAYGGRIVRWPEAERAAATALLDADTRAAAVLRESHALDVLLDGWRVDPADSVLRQSVLATAKSRSGVCVSAPWVRDVRLWFAGAGLAAGLAGVFCGAVLSTVAVGEARDEALVASAVSDTAVSLPSPAQT